MSKRRASGVFSTNFIFLTPCPLVTIFVGTIQSLLCPGIVSESPLTFPLLFRITGKRTLHRRPGLCNIYLKLHLNQHPRLPMTA